MQINPDYNTAAYTIRSYEVGEVVVYEPVSQEPDTQRDNDHQRVNTKLIKLRAPFVITPRKILQNWEIENSRLITKSHFQTLFELEPELIILGTGDKIYFPPAEDYVFLQQHGIGVEIMDTAAACRTYNFLIADGRNVVAGLFMI